MGCDHESDALQQYMGLTGICIEECGLSLSEENLYLATFPDGIIHLTNGEFGVIEVKCPFKHREHTIADACKDAAFCLYTNDSGQVQLKRAHNYYYQISGQLALTGAQCCDFIVWTMVEMHIERIFLDDNLWKEMVTKLSHFYYTTLGYVICSFFSYAVKSIFKQVDSSLSKNQALIS